MLDKIRNNRSLGVILLIAVAGTVFSFMLYCNYHTSMLVDDYGYCFDFSTGWDSPNPDGLIPPPASERITDVFSIFGSMASHRVCHSGRVLSHFLVQLFLMPPKDIFNILNSIVFIVQAVFIYLCSAVLTGRKSFTGAALSILFTFMSLFMFQPVFGEINLWLDGSLNYLWTSTYVVIYIYFYLKLFKNGKFTRHVTGDLLFVLFGFPVGLSHEVAGASMLVLSFLVIAYLHLAKKTHSVWSCLSFGSTLAGFLYLLLAPKELNTQMVKGSFSDLIGKLTGNLLDLVQFAALLMPLFLLSAILLVIAWRTGADKGVISFSVIMFLVTAASFFSLIFASYIAPRCLFITSVLLILCCTVLMSELLRKKGKHRYLICAFYVFMLIVTPYFAVKGIRDVSRTYEFTRHNEEYIIECRQNGIMDVKIPELARYDLSECCAVKYIKYIDGYNNKTWPNIYMAKYYGVDSVSFSGEIIDVNA